jgi:hypothetical protein
MTSDTEKNKFTHSLQALINACHDKAEDGGLTLAQRSIFERNELLFVPLQTKTNDIDFSLVNTVDLTDAMTKNNKASTKTLASIDEDSVQTAKDALAVALMAVDKVLE